MLRDLLQNLRAGWRLAAFRPVGAESFATGFGAFAGLVAVQLVALVACQALLVAPPRVFEPAAFHGYAFGLLLYLGFAGAAVRGAGPGRVATVLCAVMAGGLWTLPVYTALTLASDALSDERFPGLFATGPWLVQLWLAAIVYHAARLVGADSGLSTALLVVLLFAFRLGMEEVAPRPQFWWTGWDEDEMASELPDVDTEAVFHSQAALLERTRSALLPGRPGVVDLYFVAFGADASQEVFVREVRYARDLFERRFDAAGRTALLVNHESTLSELPLASGSNLAETLADVGRRMDPEEDVLFLFLTGHGSREHELAVRFWPLPLNAIDPQKLASALEASGIRNRVVVVSACYSGGFLPALQGENALVLTASAADKRSFGCSDDAEFTYFGEALLAGALEESLSFPEAFESARARVDARERAEQKDASQPQLAIGAGILPPLHALEQRLAAHALAAPR